ncbi:MAG: DUF975 family protein [Oscillospiraceae bacterium]|nr:DUF975 family protein [Oscillospiraceae bacterium]
MYVTRQELKARAKAQLDGGIFKEKWLWAVLVCLIVSAALGIISMIPVVGAAATIVITGPVMYGVNAMFLKQARNNQPMNLEDLLKGFTGDFKENFLIGLMTAIFTALWSLLFVIPGIVKAYSYSMAYYIKVDCPAFTWKQCIETSKDMMNGHKMELFVQDLSFIGWMIVGSFCLGVGTLWVMPYQYATRAHFYLEVSKEYRMRATSM